MASEYSKRPMWQFIFLYLIIGGIIYGLIYYFVYAKKGGYTYNYSNTPVTEVVKNNIVISNYSFSPSVITIKIGESVMWTNKDSMQHSATANNKTFDTGLLSQGKSGSVTFKKAGTYAYYCSLHPNMKATVIVQ